MNQLEQQFAAEIDKHTYVNWTNGGDSSYVEGVAEAAAAIAALWPQYVLTQEELDFIEDGMAVVGDASNCAMQRAIMQKLTPPPAHVPAQPQE